MNSNKKIPILIIAPFFAPQSHAAMFRVHKLVKYLPQYGYKPIVVTTDINYNYNEDLNLLDELTEDVEIHRVRYIEPTIRGLRMALGGKDRTFKAMKKNIKMNSSNDSDSNRITKTSFLKKLKSDIQNFFKTIPDAYWTWVDPATKVSNELIKKHNIKLVYTTTNPDSVLKIGLNLKSKNAIKWISDFRDPLGYGERYNTHHKLIDENIKNLHLRSMNIADKITGLSSSYEQIFKDLYHIQSNKFQFIPTGIDDEYIDDTRLMDNEEKYLIFVGEFQEKYDDYIFKVLDNVVEKENIQFKIKIIGRKEINFKNISKYMDQYKYVNQAIEFIDHIPQLELYKEIKNAHSCILLTGGENFWWCNFAKMVDYIALQKYVISDVYESSEAKKELEKTGKGIFLTKNLDNDIKIVTDHMEKTIDDFQSENEYYKRYLSSSQVKSFVEVFDNLLGMNDDKK
ncbi:hypothetical protein [Sulfurovum sp. TSL1]|uniref:hypothetical protein n=1 Tax=Sulfurovum sp. TSL1 TaxID=2826994 RepID=UPI001CC5E9A2|nr:hypothetical protein [Sulfurovum sp. TSL1]GIT98133.1 glycosyl transferase family 1 [Sulfurovum sp. TSL1]